MESEERKPRRSEDAGRRPLRKAKGPSGDPPDAADAAFAVERLSSLSHDLVNLLDGSMRCLGIALRSLDQDGVRTRNEQIDTARRQMGTVYGALERMCDLVHIAMSGASLGVGSAPRTRPVSLSSAILHATEVLTPAAEEQGITIATDAGGLEEVPAGPVYPVILNGLTNALEAVLRTGRRGRVEVLARIDAPTVPGARPTVRIEIRDDGAGLPARPGPGELFEHGVTTKAGGAGIGLAVARDIARDLGGTIELMARSVRREGDKPGTVLRLTYPLPEAPPEDRIG
jgi:two-component system sensor histidine kinase TctE